MIEKVSLNVKLGSTNSKAASAEPVRICKASMKITKRPLRYS